MAALASLARRLLAWTATAYLAGAVLTAIALRTLTDVWWPITVLAFAPRWLLAAPLPFIALALALGRRWRLLAAMLPAALALAVAVDVRVRLPARRPAGPVLTLVTLNADGDRTPLDRLRGLLSTTAAQIVAVQECEIDPDAFGDASWHVQRDHELCLLSRFEIREAEARDTDEIHAQGGHGEAVRYLLDTPSGPIAVFNVHLQTVRNGLDELVDHGFAGRAGMIANTEVRELDSSRLRRWMDERASNLPTVVMGDFNIPVESAVYKRNWSPFGNAFSSAGVGLGWSKRTRWHGTRIDHVLFGAGLRAVDASIAPSVGSDHRPVVARLALEGR